MDCHCNCYARPFSFDCMDISILWWSQYGVCHVFWAGPCFLLSVVVNFPRNCAPCLMWIQRSNQSMDYLGRWLFRFSLGAVKSFGPPKTVRDTNEWVIGSASRWKVPLQPLLLLLCGTKRDDDDRLMVRCCVFSGCWLTLFACCSAYVTVFSLENPRLHLYPMVPCKWKHVINFHIWHVQDIENKNLFCSHHITAKLWNDFIHLHTSILHFRRRSTYTERSFSWLSDRQVDGFWSDAPLIRNQKTIRERERIEVSVHTNIRKYP